MNIPDVPPDLKAALLACQTASGELKEMVDEVTASDATLANAAAGMRRLFRKTSELYGLYGDAIEVAMREDETLAGVLANVLGRFLTAVFEAHEAAGRIKEELLRKQSGAN